MNLYPYIEMSRSIVQLMQPLAEISIHNLETKRIEFIEGGISSRKALDISEFADETILKYAIKHKVFSKINNKGRLIKTIVSLIQEGGAKFLICIDYDITIFQDLQPLVSVALNFTNPIQTQTPIGSKERVHTALYSILKTQGASSAFLSRKQKKEVIKLLFEAGIFSEKKSVPCVADILKVSRATIFNYLKEWR